MGGSHSTIVRAESDSTAGLENGNMDCCQRCFLFEPPNVFRTASNDLMGSPMPDTPQQQRHLRDAAYKQVLNHDEDGIVGNGNGNGATRGGASRPTKIPYAGLEKEPSSSSSGLGGRGGKNHNENDYPKPEVHEGKVRFSLRNAKHEPLSLACSWLIVRIRLSTVCVNFHELT